MELLADRFAMMDTGDAIDLATGDRVALTITSAGGPTEQTRWAVRCHALHRLRHRAIATLVDYGAIGETQRFEAWRCGSPWTGAPAHAASVVERVAAFLRACGLTTGGVSVDAVRSSPSGAVVLPDSATGYVEGAASPADSGSVALDMCGLVIRERRVAPALADLFDGTGGMQPRIAAIWGPPGAGTSTIVADVARVARLNGFVPVAVPLDPFARLLRGRRLFLIAGQTAAGWRNLLDASLRSPRAHVLLFAGLEEVPRVEGIALERMSADALVSAVRPLRLPPDVARTVRRAAEEAEGLPGRFVRRLWRESVAYGARPSSRPSVRAAEQTAVYGVDETLRDADAALPAIGTWPAPGELAALRRRMETACRLLKSGRHEPGERALRQTIGALARRGDWAQAGTGALALASCQLKRGRPRDAQAVLEEAKEYWSRGTDDGPLVETATLVGATWIDLARLDEAESVLGAAFATGRAGNHGPPAARAGLMLARCLFWRGRYTEADQTLASVADASVTDPIAVRASVLASRVAVGRRDLVRAVGRAVEAVDCARGSGDAGLVAEAAAGAAFAHLAVGDLDTTERDVAECLTAARSVRDPLRGIRARLLLAESARRRGRRGAVTTLLQRLSTLGGAGVPPIVRVRCALLKDLVTATATEHQVVERHVAATGLKALALFAPLDGQPTRQGSIAAPALDDVVEILRVCQNAEEETAVLTDVCARLRRQLRAAAVAFVAVDGATLTTIASDGGRLEPAVAERAVAAGIAIAPHRHDDRTEAAAPVKYGGMMMGALVARWTLGSIHDLAGASTALTLAAAAAAPAMSAALTHRVRATAASGTTGLLGVSDAMAEVRRAIERAARAPFPVLIEGESGCGKELIARALHRSGTRRERPFCTLNCAALPDDLIEAELFGHARGAFTGAVAERPGVFEEAHGGTLFLDEIGELSLRAQAKVLRVIQDGELRRVGENVSRRVDVRIVAATNRELRAEAAAARFRHDLLYRLDVVRIVVPPLRDRREDIGFLADHFWREAAARVGSRATLAAATLAALARYDWPGNVRELQNVLAALAVRSPKRGGVPATALPPPFGERRAAETWRLDQARRTFEERFVRAALVRTAGHRARAASELGVTRQGLTKLMTRLGISE